MNPGCAQAPATPSNRLRAGGLTVEGIGSVELTLEDVFTLLARQT
jgi:hypothetical protein